MGGWFQLPKQEKPPEITVKVISVGGVNYETELERKE